MPEAGGVRLARLVLATAWLAAAGASLAPAQESAASDGPAFDAAARTLRCDCGCHPQSVKDCACGRAAAMRDEIRGLVAQGLDAEAIVARYVEQQGEQILLTPTATGFNLVAWLGPLIGLLLAAGGVVLLLRRWIRARAPEAAPLPDVAAIPDDGAYRDRLRRAIEGAE